MAKKRKGGKKKKGGWNTSKKSGKGKVPLGILEDRLIKLNGIVKRRKGTHFKGELVG